MQRSAGSPQEGPHSHEGCCATPPLRLPGATDSPVTPIATG